MLQGFKKDIEPLNDQLRKDLNLFHLDIKHIENAVEVPVKVIFRSRNGRTITIFNNHLRNMRALGLVI